MISKNLILLLHNNPYFAKNNESITLMNLKLSDNIRLMYGIKSRFAISIRAKQIDFYCRFWKHIKI